MGWPHVREAVVSLLTATDGLTYREICDIFADIGAPFGVVEIREAVSQLAFAGTVHLCGRVWLQKREEDGMRTRRSPNNQDRLWRLLGEEGAAKGKPEPKTVTRTEEEWYEFYRQTGSSEKFARYRAKVETGARQRAAMKAAMRAVKAKKRGSTA